MNQLKGKAIFFSLKLISKLPFAVIYFLSDALFFVFYHLTGYRKNVVLSNLKQSFPNKSEAEITKISKDFYKHLADLILESIKSFSISREEILKRVVIDNLELIEHYQKKNQNIIVVFGHYCNWEWFGLSSSAQISPEVFALYRKIKNLFLNQLIKENRGRFGLNLIAEKESYKEVLPKLNATDHWSLVGFIADQSVNPKRAYWIDFLNQKTTFVKGPERYGILTNCPIIFFDLQKLKRGFYKGAPELLVENPSTCEDGEIIEKFANRLEQQIIENPAYWLWSHKRWKHKYEETLNG